jgi:hypothetical protein
LEPEGDDERDDPEDGGEPDETFCGQRTAGWLPNGERGVDTAGSASEITAD